MAHVLLVTASTTHASATRSKAALESQGHTVTMIADSTLGSASTSGVDVIATVRATRTSVNSWLSARWVEGFPILVGGCDAGALDGETAHTAGDLGLLRSPFTQGNIESGGSSLRLRNLAPHEILAGYTTGAGSTVTVLSGSAGNFTVRETGAPTVGYRLADVAISASAPEGPYMTAVDAGEAVVSGAPHSPGSTAPARAVFCGYFYAGQTDYTTDGRIILGQTVDWLVATTDPTIALAGTQQRDAASFTASAVADVVLAGAERPQVAAFSVAVDVQSTLDLAGTQRRETAAFALAAGAEPVVPTETSTANRIGGRIRSGYGVATWAPAVVPALTGQGQAVVKAQAFGPATMQGTQPVYSISEASASRARQRILVGGHDVTYFRSVRTPDVDYQLAEPLLYGPATLVLPQVAAAFDTLGVGELKWLRPGKRVQVDRVVDDVVVATDYKGVILGFDTDGPDLSVEVGGEAQGRAALRDWQLRIFEVDRDLGQLAYRAITSLSLPFTPRYGPSTGITIGRFGGMGHLDYIHELCARGWTRAGNQWTIMPGEDGRYTMARKDTETRHFTVFTDDKRSVASLRRDISEEPNRIYVTGVTPEGQRVRFGAYPGLKQGRPADYPMEGGASFGKGTTDADTINGDGISVMLARLEVFGFIGRRDKPGGFDDDAEKAIESLQEQANLTVTGRMNEATWAALFDLDATGVSLSMANIRPAAQRRTTHKWIYTASGAVIELNPHYNPNVLLVDRTIDMGAGFTRNQLREFAKTLLTREKNWTGTITLTTGAVLRGDVAIGATVTEADVMDARDIRPGMNAWLPQFDGGILVHVSGVDVATDTVRLTVDTQARDAKHVWEVIQRNRETRRNPARRWDGNRASTEVKDSIDYWDEVGGFLGSNVDLEPGWNTVEIVAGQEGAVSQLRVELANPAEFAVAVFGRDVSAKRLNHLVPDPLTKAGTERWEKRAVRNRLEDMLIKLSEGTNEEPCGYSPGRKLNDQGNRSGHPLRGVHKSDAGFFYRCRPGRPVLTLAVWVPGANVLKRGRVMWNQLETGA